MTDERLGEKLTKLAGELGYMGQKRTIEVQVTASGVRLDQTLDRPVEIMMAEDWTRSEI